MDDYIYNNTKETLETSLTFSFDSETNSLFTHPKNLFPFAMEIYDIIQTPFPFIKHILYLIMRIGGKEIICKILRWWCTWFHNSKLITTHSFSTELISSLESIVANNFLYKCYIHFPTWKKPTPVRTNSHWKTSFPSKHMLLWYSIQNFIWYLINYDHDF